MLILTRQLGEAITIGDEIVLRVTGMSGIQVKIGIQAPREVTVMREELLAKRASAAPAADPAA
jgi:carbon storage regulator